MPMPDGFICTGTSGKQQASQRDSHKDIQSTDAESPHIRFAQRSAQSGRYKTLLSGEDRMHLDRTKKIKAITAAGFLCYSICANTWS